MGLSSWWKLDTNISSLEMTQRHVFSTSCVPDFWYMHLDCRQRAWNGRIYWQEFSCCFYSSSQARCASNKVCCEHLCRGHNLMFLPCSLLKRGYRVGIVSQVETAALKKIGDNRSGPFDRKVTQLYTQATYVSSPHNIPILKRASDMFLRSALPMIRRNLRYTTLLPFCVSLKKKKTVKRCQSEW